MAIVKNLNIVTPKRKEILFSDLESSFSTISGKKDIDTVTDEESVKNAIRNILLTDRGERFFNPSFGSNIKALLFEDISPATEIALKNFITTSIENFEPRANLLEVIVNPLVDQNAYYVLITFSIINSIEPIQLEILLNRVR